MTCEVVNRNFSERLLLRDRRVSERPRRCEIRCFTSPQQMKAKTESTESAAEQIARATTKAEVEQIVALACGYEFATDKTLRRVNRAAVKRLTELDESRSP